MELSKGASSLLRAIINGYIDKDAQLISDKDWERYNELESHQLVTLDIRGRITVTDAGEDEVERQLTLLTEKRKSSTILETSTTTEESE